MSVPFQKKFPIAVRMHPWFPEQVGRFLAHFYRKGGDLDHVDFERSHLNETYEGGWETKTKLDAEIAKAMADNLDNRIAALEADGKRPNLIEKAKREGLKDPWKKPAKNGPLREIVLTANAEWFASCEADAVLGEVKREEMFERAAISWLDEHFRDQVVFCGCHRDEDAFHIHALVVPWSETTTKLAGKQRTIKPSSHPLIRDYTKAQDAAGDWFTELGLVRGKRNSGKKNTKPEVWRRKKAEARAEAIVAGVDYLEREVLEFKPAKKEGTRAEKMDGLQLGKNAPQEVPERKKIWEKIKPGKDAVIKIAKAIHSKGRQMFLSAKAQLDKMRAELDAREKDLDAREAKITRDEVMAMDKAKALSGREKAVSGKEWLEDAERARRAKIDARGFARVPD